MQSEVAAGWILHLPTGSGAEGEKKTLLALHLHKWTLLSYLAFYKITLWDKCCPIGIHCNLVILDGRTLNHRSKFLPFSPIRVLSTHT